MTNLTIDEAMTKLFELQDKVDAITKEADVYKKYIKEEMIKANSKKLCLSSDPSRTCSLSISTRRTCKDKSGLVAQLVAAGAKHCISTEIVPNMDVLADEIDINPDIKAIYDNFVKESEVQTFKVK